MLYTENFNGIRLDIQIVDTVINNDIQQRIKRMIRRLQRHIFQINWADIYCREESGRSTNNRTIGVRLGIPGNDVFASESGIHWTSLLKKVEERLVRQLRRRKEVDSYAQHAF